MEDAVLDAIRGQIQKGGMVTMLNRRINQLLQTKRCVLEGIVKRRGDAILIRRPSNDKTGSVTTPKTSQDKQCPVCYLDIEGNVEGKQHKNGHHPVTISCGHTFGSSCITRWLSEEKGTCPLCRRVISETDLWLMSNAIEYSQLRVARGDYPDDEDIARLFESIAEAPLSEVQWWIICTEIKLSFRYISRASSGGLWDCLQRSEAVKRALLVQFSTAEQAIKTYSSAQILSTRSIEYQNNAALVAEMELDTLLSKIDKIQMGKPYQTSRQAAFNFE